MVDGGLARAFFNATIAHIGQGFADTASGLANQVLNVLTFMLRDVSFIIRPAAWSWVIPCFASISLNSRWFLSLSNSDSISLVLRRQVFKSAHRHGRPTTPFATGADGFSGQKTRLKQIPDYTVLQQRGLDAWVFAVRL